MRCCSARWARASSSTTSVRSCQVRARTPVPRTRSPRRSWPPAARRCQASRMSPTSAARARSWSWRGSGSVASTSIVNNAGILTSDRFPEMGVDVLMRHLTVHVAGTFNVTRAAWPSMVEAGYGRVVATTSSAVFGAPPLIGYATAKGALIGLARSLAQLGAGDGIRVNLLAPAADTRMVFDPALRADNGLPPLPVDVPADPTRGAGGGLADAGRAGPRVVPGQRRDHQRRRGPRGADLSRPRRAAWSRRDCRRTSCWRGGRRSSTTRRPRSRSRRLSTSATGKRGSPRRRPIRADH